MKIVALLMLVATTAANGALAAQWDGRSYRDDSEHEIRVAAMANHHCPVGQAKRYLPHGFDCVLADAAELRDERCMAEALQQGDFIKARSRCDLMGIEDEAAAATK